MEKKRLEVHLVLEEGGKEQHIPVLVAMEYKKVLLMASLNRFCLTG